MMEVGEETWVLDNVGFKFMTPNSDFMFNYRQHSGTVRTAGGRLLSIEGSGSTKVDIRSDKGMVPLHLTNVLHVPSLCHNLLSLRVLADRGHTYVGNQHGITLNLKSGRIIFAPSCGRLNLLNVYRKPQPNGVAFATIAPEAVHSPSKIDINIFHASHGHAHEGLLRATAKNLGVTLVGRLEECKGCSMA